MSLNTLILDTSSANIDDIKKGISVLRNREGPLDWIAMVVLELDYFSFELSTHGVGVL